LGIEIPDFRNQFFTRVLEGATQELADTKYQLIIAPAAAGTRAGYRAVEALIDQQVDGLIAVAPLIEKSWLEEVARRTPVVMFGRHEHSDVYDGVAGNDRAGARAVMEHLFELGHNDIMHLTIDAASMSPDRLSPQDIRLNAYLEIMEQTGRGDHAEVVRISDSQLFAYEAVIERLASGPHPTAIFAAHDELAIGVLRAITELGLDISVIGYDDVPISAHPAMSLSSVDQNGEQMGRRAAQMLLERLQGRTEPVYELFEPVLRTRRSTRPVTATTK